MLHGKKDGRERREGKKELRYNAYRYKFPIMNMIIMYIKIMPIKLFLNVLK